MVETVSGFGRWRAFSRATNRASSLELSKVLYRMLERTRGKSLPSVGGRWTRTTSKSCTSVTTSRRRTTQSPHVRLTEDSCGSTLSRDLSATRARTQSQKRLRRGLPPDLILKSAGSRARLLSTSKRNRAGVRGRSARARSPRCAARRSESCEPTPSRRGTLCGVRRQNNILFLVGS